MPVAVAEAVDLVLDRRTVARPDAARSRRRTAASGRAIARMIVVRARVGPGDRAEELGRRAALAHRRHRPVAVVGRLPLERRPVDRAAVEPRRRAGLEPRQRQAERAQLVASAVAARSPTRPPAMTAHPEMKLAAEEGAGREDHRSAPTACARRPASSAGDAPALARRSAAASPSTIVKLGLRVEQIAGSPAL